MTASLPNVDSLSEQDLAKRYLDELFSVARRYRSSEEYRELLEFVAKFPFYAPFNAMLIHIQRPGATYVAPPRRWFQNYLRRIKVGARPLLILQPSGPVMFVFDVSDTEPEQGAPTLPPEVERPFDVRRGHVRGEFELTMGNAKRDGVSVSERADGSQRAGSIQPVESGRFVEFLVRLRPHPKYHRIPLRYGLVLNSIHSAETKYATLVHELAHLYCGHLGTPNEEWWPNRQGLSDQVQEFEAESVSYLVCARLGIESPSARYLGNYWRHNENADVPAISLECVMKSAGLIEQMGRGRLKSRKVKSTEITAP